MQTPRTLYTSLIDTIHNMRKKNHEVTIIPYPTVFGFGDSLGIVLNNVYDRTRNSMFIQNRQRRTI